MTERNVFVQRGAIVFGALLLGACVVLPSGPSVMVLPGSGHNMESFRGDDMYCREYAHIQIGGKTATDAAKESAVTSAAVGTVVVPWPARRLAAAGAVRRPAPVSVC